MNPHFSRCVIRVKLDVLFYVFSEIKPLILYEYGCCWKPGDARTWYINSHYTDQLSRNILLWSTEKNKFNQSLILNTTSDLTLNILNTTPVPRHCWHIFITSSSVSILWTSFTVYHRPKYESNKCNTLRPAQYGRHFVHDFSKVFSWKKMSVVTSTKRLNLSFHPRTLACFTVILFVRLLAIIRKKYGRIFHEIFTIGPTWKN